MNKYAVTSPSRKDLVRRIAALTGLVPVYTRVPRCAYVIGPYSQRKTVCRLGLPRKKGSGDYL